MSDTKSKAAAKEIGLKLLKDTDGMDDEDRFDFIVGVCVRLSALPMVMLSPDGYSLYAKEYLKSAEEILNEYQTWDRQSNQH